MPPLPAAPFLEECQSLLAALGEALADCEWISEKSNGSNEMLTYRLSLESGRQLKARWYENLEVFERNLALRACFDLPGFPAPLAHGQGVLLEPWIEGEAISAKTIAPAQLAAAGELLAKLHTAPSPPQFGDRMAGVRARLARLEERLQDFAASEHLTPNEAEALLQLARETAPHRNERGLVHRDLRPDNLLWCAGGMVSIDNDTLDFGPYEEDLARVWLLWPMTEAQRTDFWRGYARRRDPSSFLNHFAFWAIYSCVCCLQYRLQAQSYGWEIPLERLHELAALTPAASVTTL